MKRTAKEGIRYLLKCGTEAKGATKTEAHAHMYDFVNAFPPRRLISPILICCPDSRMTLALAFASGQILRYMHSLDRLEPMSSPCG